MSQQNEVLAYLQKNGPKTLDEITSGTGLPRTTVRGRLSMLREAGKVSTDSNKKDKKFSAVEEILAQ